MIEMHIKIEEKDGHTKCWATSPPNAAATASEKSLARCVQLGIESANEAYSKAYQTQVVITRELPRSPT